VSAHVVCRPLFVKSGQLQPDPFAASQLAGPRGNGSIRLRWKGISSFVGLLDILAAAEKCLNFQII
jgi:hypothetical protein